MYFLELSNQVFFTNHFYGRELINLLGYFLRQVNAFCSNVERTNILWMSGLQCYSTKRPLQSFADFLGVREVQ